MMSRIITVDGAGQQRTRLNRAVAVAVRLLARQPEFGTDARDLTAFIVLALEAIAGGLDESLLAWEKRGYWVKADKFRMEWAWCAREAAKMRAALLRDDASGIAAASATIATKLAHIHVAENHRLGTPWAGALAEFTKTTNDQRSVGN